MTLVRIGFLTLCLFICISAKRAGRRRSIGSTKASNIPYQVSIQNPSGNHLCGGAILDATHILTAAYCVVDADRNPYPDVREIVVGTIDRFNLTEDNIFQIVKKTIHENFSAHFFFQHDIAVLKLDKEITFTPYQKPVKLPRNHTRAGMVGITSGWGVSQLRKLHEEDYVPLRFLRYFHQKVISAKKCQKMMPSVTIYPTHLCAWAGGKSASCKGDSGGPLIVGGYIVGINSWNEYCDPSYPDIYTRVYSYVDWIKTAMAD